MATRSWMLNLQISGPDYAGPLPDGRLAVRAPGTTTLTDVQGLLVACLNRALVEYQMRTSSGAEPMQITELWIGDRKLWALEPPKKEETP